MKLIATTGAGEYLRHETPRSGALARERWRQQLETALAQDSVCRAVRNRAEAPPLGTRARQDAPPMRRVTAVLPASGPTGRAGEISGAWRALASPSSLPAETSRAAPGRAAATGLPVADSLPVTRAEPRPTYRAIQAASVAAPWLGERYPSSKLTLYLADGRVRIWLRDQRLGPAQIAKVTAQLSALARENVGQLGLLVINGVVIQSSK